MKKKAFTLIELIVVVAIIGILATVIAVNLNGARTKARDAKRRADLKNVSTALELHYDKVETYKVANSGWSNTGEGWLSLVSAGDLYTKSISGALAEEGFLADGNVHDPIYGISNTDGGDYMLYLCGSGKGYTLSGTLEQLLPTDTPIDASHVCNTNATTYHNNFAINKKP